MNFEPPDNPKDVPLPSRSTNIHPRSNQYQSPLLNTNPNFTKNFSSNMNKKPSSSHFNGAIHNRLGNRGPYGNNNTTQHNNHERNDKSDWNFNRKRKNNDGTVGPMRKWNRNKFYQNSNNNQHNNSAQNRMNRIRSSNQNLDSIEVTETKNSYDSPEVSNLNDSQEFDATDITVEVINHNAQPKEETNPVRFKMVLDPKTQAAIKVIQQKRKDKQVIFPFPVTPNTTEISLHERFTVL